MKKPILTGGEQELRLRVYYERLPRGLELPDEDLFQHVMKLVRRLQASFQATGGKPAARYHVRFRTVTRPGPSPYEPIHR